jgi:hypothetical protein
MGSTELFHGGLRFCAKALKVLAVGFPSFILKMRCEEELRAWVDNYLGAFKGILQQLIMLGLDSVHLGIVLSLLTLRTHEELGMSMSK